MLLFRALVTLRSSDPLLSTAGRSVPIAATHIYQMSFFTGFGVSAVVYCSLSYAFPPVGMHRTFEEIDVSDISDEDRGFEVDDKSSIEKKDATVAITDAV